MYDINVNFTVAGNTAMTFPNLKLMKDFIKQALQPEDGSLKGLDCINYVKQGESVRNLVDITKWFFESYHSSHANKAQKQWIEENIFKTTTKDKLKSFLTEGNVTAIRDQAIQDQKDYLK